MLGPTELLVIAAIIILLFIPRQLPKLAKGFGESIREFKKVKKEISEVDKDLKSMGGS